MHCDIKLILSCYKKGLCIDAYTDMERSQNMMKNRGSHNRV